MFFATYLRRELRRRMRQAIFVALGLAVGIGLVVTVSAASAGVKKAESSVLASLYGVGTDVTVTGEAPQAKKPSTNGQPPKGGTTIQGGPNGATICQDGKCENAAGKTISSLAPQYLPIKSAEVADVARLHDVAAAAGGLLLTDNTITFPKDFGGPGGSQPPTPSTVSVDGVAAGHTALGPLSAASLTSGHSFSAADSDAHVAVVDSGYATSNNLKVGSTITVDSVKFKVIGIVRQPQSASPPDVYIPLEVAQGLKTGPLGVETGDVNTIYVTATSAADISAVQHEIAKLLPHATVTTAASLANEVTGSVANAAKLANDLGKWLAILVLIAAFAVASLLTMSAVARRVAEFGTLKAHRLADPPDRHPGARRVRGHGRHRRRAGRRSGLRGRSNHQQGRAQAVRERPDVLRRLHPVADRGGPRRRHARLESRLGDARRGRPVASVHHRERDRAGGDPGRGRRAAGRRRSGAGGSPGCGPSTPSLRLRDPDRQDLSRTGEDPCTS